MKAVLLKGTKGFGDLQVVELPEPLPAPGEVLVRVRATSLNYRDILVTSGGYGSRQKQFDLIPLSDGAGEVVEVGQGVHGFAPGDRVTGCFFQTWVSGQPTSSLLDDDLGRAHDGVLCELKCFKASGLVRTPELFSDVEAASTPCAGLTAWNGVIGLGKTRPGDTVLIQGTGGVSIFALQFAKLAGAMVIATSSSKSKLDRLKEMGANYLINYKDYPNWGEIALELTEGRGADLVVEVGGAGTIKQSLRAVRPGGMIGLVGVLAGARSDLLIPLVGSRNVRLQGITVGCSEDFVGMLRAMRINTVRPVIDKVFSIAETRQAYQYLYSGKHFGKVCITL